MMHQTYHKFSAQCDKSGGDGQRQDRNPDAELRLFLLVVFLVDFHLLRVLAAHGGRHLANLGQAATGIALRHLLAPLLDLGAGSVVDLGVRLELEEEVASVDEEQNDTGACVCQRQSSAHCQQSYLATRERFPRFRLYKSVKLPNLRPD